jgi:hypothetical protein
MGLHYRAVDDVEVELHHSPARRQFRSLLYDALDFSTDRDDGGGQTRESLSRVASPSAAVAALDPARTETHVALCDYRLAAVFDRVKAEGLGDSHLLLSGTARVKFRE